MDFFSMSKCLFILLCIVYIEAVQVQVEQGVLEGEILETVDGVASYYSFKGIPYAAPPVGDLRFKAPQAPLPWEEVRDAKQHGSMCPHYDNLSGLYVNQTEDCLFLNVYSPDIQPETPLPVMFYIHGGGYKYGSGDESDLGPDFLVSKDVILITFNYRLDAIGFLCLDIPEVPGNAGSKDQVAALRWVAANIASFGGDPDNITIFGESAGSASVGYFLMSPMTKGLIKRAIMLSGSPFSEFGIPFRPADRGIALGKLLGSNTNDPHETYEFLKTLPIDDLINKTVPIMLTEQTLMPFISKAQEFVPVVEKDFGQERFVTDEVLKLLNNGSVQDVSILFGRTDQEALVISRFFEEWVQAYNLYPDLLMPRDLLYSLTPDEILESSKLVHEYYFGNKTISIDSMPEFIKASNEVFIDYSVHRFFNKLPVSDSSKRFAYIFSALTDRNRYGLSAVQYGVTGAGHLDDLAHLFDPKSLNLSIDMDSVEYQVIQTFTTLFTNFAKYGHPTPDDSFGFIWPEYTPSGGEYLDIGVELALNTGMTKESQEFWENIYDIVGIEY